jgi:hypothetical protein
MLLPRMTIRRWMVAVIVASIFVKSGIASERYWRLRSHYASVLRGYKAAMQWRDEGRLNVVESVLASERLMEAEFRLSATKRDQLNAVTAHLRRARQMFVEERNELPFCYDNREMWISEAEATLVNWEALVKNLNGTN